MLGDGEGAEHISKNNKRFDIQFKGSARHPQARDKSSTRSMLREYLISEAVFVKYTNDQKFGGCGRKRIRERSCCAH